MSPRYKTTPVRIPPAPADPWRSSATPGNQESNGGWVLSYLDVMTILFTFFVLLFAYQKAMSPSSAKPHKPAVAVQAKAAAAQTKGQGENTAGATAAPPATQQAVAAMKSQALAMSGVRGSSDGPQTSGYAVEQKEPASLTDKAVAGAAQLGSEQTARLMAKALERERENRQVEVVHEGRQIRVEISDAILFDPGSAELRQEGYALLDRINGILAGREDILFIEGHTDPTPIANNRFPSNWELSSARASAVTRYLVAHGLPAERLRAIGLADTRPLGDNATAEGRARNRRVTLLMGSAYPS
ncbi:OmpA family protein [Methylococcus sp. EFPC2]|uniref:OmpA/MotB family protein n=1 Tax=Methylococcus sp. EFPC2 TaxID=2812648 RepID=UPI001967E5B9|nr:OmpA family protein [Methylococcus sp. EFPC2]QSA96190.1 OmpA family protein [Methylococcus sp. EFPC2]